MGGKRWGRFAGGFAVATLLVGCAIGVDPEPSIMGPASVGHATDPGDGDGDGVDSGDGAGSVDDGGGTDGGVDPDGSGSDDQAVDDTGTDGDDSGDEGDEPILEHCGDGAIDPGEECDDGAANAPDALCTPGCQFAECGDGFHYPVGEECDDGNLIDTDACTVGCVTATCGDGIVHAGVELCDDGNGSDSDGCTSQCTLASCGDGVIQAPETCDDGNASNTDNCLSTCLPASCGDGFVHSGVEQCDDGNASNTDACVTGCQAAACGDGYVHTGVEQCDGAGDPEVYSCSASCQDQQVWYQWSFAYNNLPNPMACADFTTWRSALANDHTSITIAGTNAPSGRTCNGASATTLCNALRNGTNATVNCGGHTWHVGANCVGTLEVTVDSTVCDCAWPGYALRPCINGVDWGGVNTSTCSGPTQEIYIECGF